MKETDKNITICLKLKILEPFQLITEPRLRDILSMMMDDLLLVSVLLLHLLNLLGGGPLTRRVHHARHHRARHWTVAVPWGAHGWSLRCHTIGWRHAGSLNEE